MNRILAFKFSHYYQYLIIFLAALVLITPQLFNHSIVIGSDALFHFNRFYDTAMQIKHGEFNYFATFYGFQQSGRIVNAFYGPLWAYFNGLLVLIAGSWFKYQLLSNLLVYCLSGFSLYAMLKKARVTDFWSILFSLFYMLSFSIQYWVERQGFTSWGAAVLPLCLLPMITLYDTGKLPILKTAFFLALAAQIHLLTTLMVIVIYIGYFSWAFWISSEKKQLLKNLGLAILLFIGLTANLTTSFIYLYSGNKILSPFTNHRMGLFTITDHSYYWLLYPIILPALMLLGAVLFLRDFKKINAFYRITGFLALFFLGLSTNLIPWTQLVAHKTPLVTLIQFPFRFFTPFTVLFFLSLGKGLTLITKASQRKIAVSFLLGLAVSLSVNFIGTAHFMSQWKNLEEHLDRHSVHTYMSDDNHRVKQAFFSSDLAKGLQVIQKSTPDYLPKYANHKVKGYHLYKKNIIDKNQHFDKKVADGQLVITWQQKETGWIDLPVILYEDSLIRLKNNSSEIYLSEIGTAILYGKKGENQATLDYPLPLCVGVSLVITGLSYAGVLGCLIKKNSSLLK